MPMADAAQAHRLMEAGDHVGKILLTLPEKAAPSSPPETITA